MTISLSEQKQTKVCSKCYDELPLTFFNKNQKMRDGVYSFCKKCMRAKCAKWRQENKDRLRAYRRRIAKEPKRKAANKEYKKRWRATNPIKHKAHIAVSSAIQTGRLVKPNVCSECGESKLLHGHHDDYRNKLAVRWLCIECHAAWHKENGEGAY